MRKTLAVLAALALLLPTVAMAQVSPLFPAAQPVNPISNFSGSNVGQTCMLIKYVGTGTITPTSGKPTVAVAAGGDMTLSINGAGDTTTGSPTLNGVFDLSTPAAAVDTMGELVNLINTTGSNWKAALVGCLASDLTDNTINTLSTTDAATPKGVALLSDNAVAHSSGVFTAQLHVGPPPSNDDIRFYMNSAQKMNPNAFASFQPFVQFVREKITSTGTVALFEVLGVTRVYDASGKVSETVRQMYGETGGATTVEKVTSVGSGPFVGNPGETIVVRQSTGTDLTATSIQGSGFNIKVPK